MAGTSLLAQSTDRPPQDHRPPFLKTLQELDLTNEQKREVLTVLREYRGNYRLTPEVQHPGHVIDVAAAVAWVHDHIDEYGGAPESLFVMGHSAGAHLAALVATDETRLKKHDKDLSIIDGVVLLDGAGYNIPAKLKLGNSIANSMYLKAFTEDEATQKNASPIYHVKSGKEIPPFLIIPIARRSDSNQLSEALRDALTAAEVEASIHVAEGKTHGSVNSDIGKPGDQPTAAMMEFLNRIMIGK